MSKNKKIVANVEPIVYQAVMNAATQEGISASTYSRRVIMQDLIERGLLTTETVASLNM